MKPGGLRKDAVNLALFAFYLYVLFKIILFKFGPVNLRFLWRQLAMGSVQAEDIAVSLHHGNLIPLKEIFRSLHVLSAHDLINLAGNIAIFMPLGIFVGIFSKNKRISLAGMFLRAFGLSLILELSQALFSIGRFDIDDLILNSAGGLIGYMGYKLFGRLSVRI
ncbi:VanZ family protein [Paenibacillus hamazuiensis]|uniref:VanZ family protein n=1 Tax=Paenibacillus hamazuiensis TaxID=2936508 RepID=UPI00200BF68E|nr:VanZ family protein [Paenibacillus hamazuiensis]